jgi:nucleotide-binding universal stress UspA family protein
MMITPTTHQPLKILLADDGSQHAMTAVVLLRDLLKDEKTIPRSSVTVLGIFTPRQISDHEMIRAGLEQSRLLLRDKGIPAKAELLLGYPAEKLIEYADENEPDLIVVGAKGLRATLGILLGGVAQQIVEYAHWPVLVVRPPYNGLHRILLVIDGSPHSQLALNYLAGMAGCPRLPLPENTDVQVMHILPPLSSEGMVAAAWAMEPEIAGRVLFEPSRKPDWQIQEEREAQEMLNKAVETLISAGVQASPMLRRGDAATEIIEYAKTNQVDLIVAGSRGLSQVEGWLLGSVSRKLVHYAGCSVLIVRGVPDQASQEPG